jgi:hypothetical protein
MQFLKETKAWAETKKALLEGVTPSKTRIVELALENQRKYLMETAAADTVSTGNFANFQKIMMPMIRRVIPGTIATELVGVQPLTGPTGLIYSMRYTYMNSAAGTEAGSTINAGDEAFGNTSSTAPFAGRMRRFYSGGVSPAASGGLYNAVGVNVGGPYTPAGAFSQASTPLSGNGGDVIDMESFASRRGMGLQILRQSVEAKTRTLQAKWSMEAMQDLSSQFGLDLEAEVTQALSAEIVHEIDQEIITDLITLSGTVELFDMAGAFTGTPHYVGDRHAVLGGLINKVANDIGAKTRRGMANWAVVNPTVVSALQSAAKSVFAPAVSGSFEGPNNTKLVGTLNGQIKVYTMLFDASFGPTAAAAAVPLGATASSNLVLIGYKGGNGEADAGYFYSPYVPLMTTATITDPSTYNHQLAVLTRYGKASFTSTSTSLGQSSDYYGRIVVNNLTFV